MASFAANADVDTVITPATSIANEVTRIYFKFMFKLSVINNVLRIDSAMILLSESSNGLDGRDNISEKLHFRDKNVRSSVNHTYYGQFARKLYALVPT